MPDPAAEDRPPVVILPTYNEADNVVPMVEALRALLEPVDVLVVDDNSPDGTAALAREAGERLGGVHVLVRDAKTGLGDAYRAGIRWAVDAGYTTCVQMDCDFSHDPEVLPVLLGRHLDGADMVIGSRYVPGGSIPNWPLHRRLLSRFANRFATLLLGLPYSDVTSGFRVWDTTLLERIQFEGTRSSGYLFLPELTFRAKMAGAVIAESPISFRDRTRGQSKMSARIIAESMVRITIWGIQTRLRYRRARLTPITEADRRLASS